MEGQLHIPGNGGAQLCSLEGQGQFGYAVAMPYTLETQSCTIHLVLQASSDTPFPTPAPTEPKRHTELALAWLPTVRS